MAAIPPAPDDQAAVYRLTAGQITARLAELDRRADELGAALRRTRQQAMLLGFAALALGAWAAMMPRGPGADQISARSFALVDERGDICSRWDTVGGYPRVILASRGGSQALLTAGANGPELQLFEPGDPMPSISVNPESGFFSQRLPVALQRAQ